MNKSLFEFMNRKKEAKADTVKNSDQNFKEEDVKKKYDNYSKMSENDLMKELYKEVGKQKASGSFDINKLTNQLENIKHMLNEEQYANLQRILKNIK